MNLVDQVDHYRIKIQDTMKGLNCDCIKSSDRVKTAEFLVVVISSREGHVVISKF